MGPTFRQRIPRPALVRAGETPPWSGWRPGPIALADVRAAFADRSAPLGLGDLLAPAESGSLTGAPGVGEVPALDGSALDSTALDGSALDSTVLDAPVLDGAALGAAVLVALFEEAGEARLVLIRRAGTLKRDAGHVALPGGHVEAGEPPLAAALRESEEEIGLDPALVVPIGVLPALVRPRSAQRVLPVVATLAARPQLVPNPAEVEAIIDVALAELAAARVAWEERWGAGGHPVAFFAAPALGEDLLWGLTARIVWTLLARVLAA